MRPRPGHGPLYAHLYFQVLVAIAIGVLLGTLAPSLAIAMKPLGDGFIKLIKMMIAPIIFATVVVGIAKVGDLKEVGRVGLKALLYFEAVSTVALVIGLVVANLVRRKEPRPSRGGFITLAATLSTTGTVPVAGLALLLGVDRFMSEARAITNLIGNGVATMVVARWEGALDLPRALAVLAEGADPDADEPDAPGDAPACRPTRAQEAGDANGHRVGYPGTIADQA